MNHLALVPSRVSRSTSRRTEALTPIELTPNAALGTFRGLGTGVVIGSLMWLAGILICRSLF